MAEFQKLIHLLAEVMPQKEEYHEVTHQISLANLDIVDRFLRLQIMILLLVGLMPQKNYQLDHWRQVTLLAELVITRRSHHQWLAEQHFI